jgi:hypothetical protein
VSQNIKIDALALAEEVAELRRENAKMRAALQAILQSAQDYGGCGYGCNSCDYCSDVPGIAKAALGLASKEAQP